MSTYDPSLRRLSPIVDRFVTTDLSLLAIIRAAPGARSTLVTAIQYVHESLLGERLARDAVQLARGVPIKGSDPELLVLLFSGWSELLCRIGSHLDARALLHQARSFLSDQAHPEIAAVVACAESTLADATGNKAEAESILRALLDRLPPHSSRRKFYVWELGLLLARRGQALDLRAELRELGWQCTDRFPFTRLLLVQFIDAVECGRIQEASNLMGQIESSPQVLRELARVPYRGYQMLLNLMHDAEAGRAAARPPLTTEQIRRMPGWCAITEELLRRDGPAALRIAREGAGRGADALVTSGFDSYALVRAELASRNFEAATRLIELRRKRGNVGAWDHFFLAQAAHLAGNARAAGREFAELLKALQTYDARGRLDFELRLAIALSEGDAVALTSAAGQVPATATADDRAARPAPRPAGTAGTKSSHARRGLQELTGRSTFVQQVRQTIAQYAPLDAPILITGETGTGKEVIARAIHAAGPRAGQPFIAVNCGSLTETLLESELFGHEKGSFTGADRTTRGLFEEAGAGTLFLDEIGEVSARIQVSLLRVLETGEIRSVGSARTRTIACRVIAATNTPLEVLAGSGQFRRDLLYRLERLVIHVPPLRERQDDILPLVRHFLDDGRRIGAHASLDPRLVEAFQRYSWPGNVRELRNAVERMRLVHSDKLHYDLGDLDDKFRGDSEFGIRNSEFGTRGKDAGQVTIAAGPVAPQATRLPLPVPPPAPPETPEPPPEPRVPQPELDPAAFLEGGRSQLRRLDRLRALFEKHGKLTRNEAIELLQVSPNTATKDLKTLCDEGFIERVEPSASTRSHYFRLRRPVQGLAD